MEPVPAVLEGEVLTSGPPGKSFKLWLLRLWAGETFSLSLFLLFLKAYSPVVACALGACVHVCRLFATPWTVACQAPLCMGFPRQEYWSGLPLPSPGDRLDPEIKPASPVLQADSFPLSHLGSHTWNCAVQGRWPPKTRWVKGRVAA